MQIDELFRGDEDWWHNACIYYPASNRRRWRVYAKGYKIAADKLIGTIGNGDRFGLDYIIYPIVFLYRQSIELCLKIIISNCQYLADVEIKLQRTHRIDTLWEIVCDFLKTIDVEAELEDSREQLDDAEKYIKQFAAVDPTSESFRYPVTTKGDNAIPKDIEHINVRHLYQIMDELWLLLDGILETVTVYADSKAEYESEMRRLYSEYSE